MLARDLIQQPRTLTIAHRGNSSAAPENTLPAFQSAVELQADLVELDYHHTADGVPIVIHDDTLDRTTNARQLWQREKIAVASTSLAQAKTLDAGAWFAPRFADTRLPTLEEALGVIQSGAIAALERKAGDAATLVRLLRKLDLVERVVLQSFDWQFLRDCRNLDARLVLSALGDGEISPQRLDDAANLGASIICWNHPFVDAPQIAAIHARRCLAWVYTVDDPVRARRLIAFGLNALTTNRPGDYKVESSIG
jgi:glycerophosphoryl diester phosphodiesterase